VAMTRLDCVTGSASGMRAALSQAIHHARHRSAFGRVLAEQPVMRNVLADLALESEAAVTLAMRLAGAADRGERAFQRLVVAIGKYWVCKRQPAVVGEALECLGGNGYVEDSPLPRLFRDSPLNSIWEGSGNVQVLDVLRTLRRGGDSFAAYVREVELAAGGDRRLDAAIAGLKARRAEPEEAEARRLVERMALVLQASLLVRHAPAEVADAFCASRLDGDWGHAFGTLPPGAATEAILQRAAPA
jgi:putative acyl-CoA dehydrogenase